MCGANTYEDRNECVPKRRHIKFRRWGIIHTQEYNKSYNVSEELNTAGRLQSLF